MTMKEISANIVKMASTLFCKAISIGLVSSMFLAPLAEAANISSATRAKRAIFQYASRSNLNALKRIQDRGISLDIPDENGNTALCSAVYFRSVSAYNTLVEAGADLNADCMHNLPKENRDRFCINENLIDRSICSPSAAATGAGISTTALVVDAAAVGVVGIAAAAAISGSGGGGGGGDTPTTCTTAADCNNHGSCTDGSCVCDEGYTGDHCETDTACAGVDCGAHGTCSAGACVCEAGYSGEHCEIEAACEGVDCGTHGSCSAGICVCTDDYSGEHCEIAPDTCKGIDCGAHGVCKAGLCECLDGWQGEFCTIEPDPCFAVDCGTHGKCDSTVLEGGKGTCVCDPDWGGKNCEIPPITKVPGTDAVLVDDAVLCDASKGYQLINGVCTKPFTTYTPGEDTSAISLTPYSSDDDWAAVTNIGTGATQYPSKPVYLAEFGGSVTNEEDPTDPVTKPGIINLTGSTTQQVGMWANGVSKDAVTADGKNVNLAEASVADNAQTGVINAKETSSTQAGVIAMKATSAGTIKNEGTINVTSFSPNYSAAMAAPRYKENTPNTGANIINKGTINLTAKGDTQQLTGIDSLDRIILNDHSSEINITLGQSLTSPSKIGEVVGVKGTMAVNRGTISVAADETLATEDVIHTIVKAMEAAPNGSVYNDSIINLNLTNIKRSLYGLYADAGGAGTKAVNNGLINVTGILFNDSAIAKHVYLMGSGDGTTTLTNEGIINLGETNELDPTDTSGYLDVSRGGILHVMDGGVQGTVTNNQKINFYLTSSGTTGTFKISAMNTLQGASINNGTIEATLTGSTDGASTFYALDSSASQEITQTNNGIIRITSALDGVGLAALNGDKTTKENAPTGKIYITSTAYNSDISIAEGGGVAHNEGIAYLVHEGGSGDILGVGGGNRGSIYIRANDMLGSSRISGGETAGHVSGQSTADDESGLINIELKGSTTGKVYGYEYVGNYEYRLSNYISISAMDPERNGNLFVSGMYTNSYVNPGQIGTGTLVRGGDTNIYVHDSPYGTTQVWGLYGVDNNARNDAVINLYVTAENTASGYATQVIGMETLDTNPRYLHKQYKAINNNTIRIDYTGDAHDQTDTNSNIPFDVVGMATNSYAENRGAITIKVSGDAKAAGMVAYDGGVIVNTGTITFEGNANNFTPFYAVGKRDIITDIRQEEDLSITVLAWEKAYATVYNSGTVYINGSIDADESKLYTGNFYEGSSNWARSLYVLNEDTSSADYGKYMLDDNVCIDPKDKLSEWGWYSSDDPPKIRPKENPYETTHPDYVSSKSFIIAEKMGYVSEAGGVFSAEGYQLVGDVTAGASLIMGGNKDVYIGDGQGQGALIGNGNAETLGLVSESILFDATYQNNANNANGLDIVLTRRSFNEVVSNDSLASFLEANYTAGRNEAFFDQLKSFGDRAALTNSLNKLMGQDMLTRFNYEDLTMMRELNFDMNRQLFHNKDQAFSAAGVVMPMAFRGDIGSNSRYSLFNKRSGPLSVGLGIAFTNLRSNNSHNDDDRNETMYQLVLPIGYRVNGFNLLTSPRIGYARGTYDRTGFDERSYNGHIEKRVFGLMNEARYPIAFDGWTLEPAAEFNVLGYTQRGHEDAKEYSLYLKSQKTYSVETGLGLYLGQEKELSHNSRLNILTGVAVYHEFADPYKMEIGMNGMDGSYTLRDENRSKNRGVIRLGVDYRRGDYTIYGSALSYIDREVRSSIKTGFKWSF